MSDHDATSHRGADDNGSDSALDHHVVASGVKRDAASARKAAAERIETAEKIASAVDAYHNAADRIDAAQAELKEASGNRTESLRVLRTCGLTVSEISSLTGLSSSRVQSLLQA